MYKMKEVCQMTGLTEKAIRIYMERKLVEPEVEEGLHRKSYFFKEKDIERLKDISALRNAGFSMAEIKQMLESPANISAIVEERETVLALEIQQKIAVREALNHLTIQEHSDVTKLADAMEPRSTYAKETPKRRMSRKKKWIILTIIVLISSRISFKVTGKAGILIEMLSFGLVFGIIAVITAFRYILYSRHTIEKECCGVGKIMAVVENEKVEEYIGKRERSVFKDIMAYLAFGLFGEGIWDMLRPDCWYPVISYKTEDGKVHTATVRYGGFKNSWKIGEELKITWEEGKERLVYTNDQQVFRKKAVFYIAIGIVLLSMFGICANSLFGEKENSQPSYSTFETEKLEYPENADRVVIKQYDDKCYELNEEEKQILRNLFQNAEIGMGEKYYSVDFQGTAIYFYQGEEEIDKFIAGNFNYILTSNYMLYKVMPIQIELNGTQLGDTNYIAGFMSMFAGKVRQRYVTEEILESISDLEHLKDLKQLLEDLKNFDGAYDIKVEEGYQFILSSTGFQKYFDKSEEEFEQSKLEVILQNGKFISAELTRYYYNEIGEHDIVYKKEWTGL